MDRALDEVISERQRSNRGGGGSGGRYRRRDNGRDGGRDRNRKNERDTANLDDEWIHDKYDEDEGGSRRPTRRAQPARYERTPEADLFGRDRDRGTKIRVENLHWDLNETDLTGLFERIGPILRLSIDYDRSGRSTGTAYVTYADALDARDAVREFDGANAKGQPIRLTIVPSGPGARGGRNPFDSVQAPSRSLFDRIEGGSGSGSGGGRDESSRNRNNAERERSRSPGRKRADLRAAAREDIDRYVPSDRSRSRSPRRRGNDRGGRRRDGGAPGRREPRNPRSDDQGHRAANGRPRMTQEELDRDMDNYFKSNQKNGAVDAAVSNTAAAGAVTAGASVPPVADDDIDMIE